jgi:hypothetical protein
VNSSAIFNCYDIGDNADPELIRDSIKLGYWDNFDEDQTYSGQQWSGEDSIRNNDLVDADDELVAAANTTCYLDDFDKWNWSNFSFRAHVEESLLAIPVGSQAQMKQVAWILFRNEKNAVPSENNPAVIHVRPGLLEWDGDDQAYAYLNWWDRDGKVEFMTPGDALVRNVEQDLGFSRGVEWLTKGDAINGRYQYNRDGSSGQVRILTQFSNDEWETYDRDPSYDEIRDREWAWLKRDLPYDRRKTFNITTNQPISSYNDPRAADHKNITVNIWTSGGDNLTTNPLEKDLLSDVSTEGLFAFHGWDISVTVDDVRIIPEFGNYTSATIPSPTGGDVTWGTITGTLTQSTTDTDKYGDIILQTSEDGFSDDEEAERDPPLLPGDWSDGIPDNDGIARASLTDEGFLSLGFTDNSIQYKAWMINGDSEIKETPILEDITITYLPRVQILSWKTE